MPPPTTTTTPKITTPKVTYKSTHGTTRVGDGLRSIGSALFTKENVASLTSGLVGVVSTKLQSSASKQGEQRAIDYENAKARTLAEQNKALELSKITPTSGEPPILPINSPTPTLKDEKPKWVMPVAIGGGLLIIGAIVFVVMRGKKQP
jgi:hypothetical protein